MYYFAYGSNMLTARLARRVPTVRPRGPATLTGHQLYFHLLGGDGSGKCNVVPTGDPDDCVHGVLFELDADRLDQLHRAEGPAYEFLELGVTGAAGSVRTAIYRGRAEYLDDALKPFDWYLSFVTRGAREHGLPADYRDFLEATPAVPDADAARAAENRAILDEKAANVLGDDVPPV